MTDIFDTIADGGTATEAPPEIVDRSTAERYCTCPLQGVLVEAGKCRDGSPAADSGSAVHDVISGAIAAMLRHGGWKSERVDDVREFLQAEIKKTRPDIQPDAIKGLRPSVWKLAQYLGERNPEDIMRFDGGEGDQSGQIAWDVDNPPARLTCELDLLTADSPTHAVLDDWKSGHKLWTPTDIKESFQFGTWYSTLVFLLYPDLESLDVAVWNTRFGQRVRTTLYRQGVDWRLTRIETALLFRRLALEAAEPMTWPDGPKCARCPAIHLCPTANGTDEANVDKDPAAFVRRLAAMDARLKAATKAAKAYVAKHGPVDLGDRLWPIASESWGLSKIDGENGQDTP